MSLSVVRHPIAWLIALAVLGVLALSSVSMVPETAQGVVTRLGEPIGTINRYRPDATVIGGNAGLFAHLPFVEQVLLVDRRPRSLELSNQEIASAPPAVRFVADVDVRFRITDPLLMLKRAGSEAEVASRLEAAVASALRTEAGRRPQSALYGADDENLANAALARAEPAARQLGATLLSIRLERTNLPSGAPLDQALDSLRAKRHAEAQQIAATADSEASGIRATADAEAARIYADSYGRDPEFYDFYRAMQSYRKTLTQGTTVVLSPDSDYLRQFRGH